LRVSGEGVRVVEVEEALLRLDAQEGGDVLVVGQGRREADHANHLLRRVRVRVRARARVRVRVRIRGGVRVGVR